jgi:hypothetical protein
LELEILAMKPESRVRDYFEIVGIISLIASLLFVGWQLKLTQDMNIAQLHYNRLSLYQDRFTATLESETLLSVNSKRFIGTWDKWDLTPMEIAAAETQAQSILVEWEYEYRLIEQGYSIRTIEDLRGDIESIVRQYPEVTHALSFWNVDGSSYAFVPFMHGILETVRE